jgi:hypothetical protein
MLNGLKTSSYNDSNFDKTVKAAKLIKKEAVTMTPDYNVHYINTDQTGCTYCVNIRQT